MSLEDALNKRLQELNTLAKNKPNLANIEAIPLQEPLVPQVKKEKKPTKEIKKVRDVLPDNWTIIKAFRDYVRVNRIPGHNLTADKFNPKPLERFLSFLKDYY